jgi:predicted ester cyclase
MKAILVALAAVAAAVAVNVPAFAQSPDEAARANVAPFYDALTAAPGKDVGEFVRSVTAPNWLSCGANEACRTRDQVIAAVTGLQQVVPDLKWEMKEVLVADNRIIVRGEATGTPKGELMGASPTGKSFKLMSIDVHTLKGGKLTRSYHVEDWMGAIRQLSVK